MTPSSDKPVPFIELEFAPSMKLIHHVREFAQSFYAEVLGDDDALSRLAVATHELLENAVKNAQDEVARVRLEYRPQTQQIFVRTFNRPTSEHLAILKRKIDEINAASDAEAHYQFLLKESLKLVNGSGLGLGRVAAEARFSLRYEQSGGGVWVIAEGSVRG